jgi:SAM-dependent methyltransferase
MEHDAVRECGSLSHKAKMFFEDLWQRGDLWEFETSEFEQTKYTRQLALLGGRRYTRALELGCGGGAFTHLLARHADQVVALDISPTAIARAGALEANPAAVAFRVANIMEYDLCAEGPWDLIVISDTICYLGWLYSFFEIGWLASQIFTATRDGGYLLLANTLGAVDKVDDILFLPWLIRTYQALFLNIGYHLEAEEIFHGMKHDATVDVLISLLAKGPVTASNGW